MASSKSTRRQSRRPEYESWSHIVQRCCNPNNRDYPDYGGRGIYLWMPWRNSFEQFLADVGSRPGPEYSIGRIDNGGHYEPGNVIWATATEQAQNRRSNRLLTFQGKTQSVAAWGAETGLGERTLSRRLHLGWNIEDALTAPKRRNARLLTFRGQTHNAKEWADVLGLNYQMVHRRLQLGWSIEEALTIPTGGQRA